jgi:hypothetical protein
MITSAPEKELTLESIGYQKLPIAFNAAYTLLVYKVRRIMLFAFLLIQDGLRREFLHGTETNDSSTTEDPHHRREA